MTGHQRLFVKYAKERKYKAPGSVKKNYAFIVDRWSRDERRDRVSVALVLPFHYFYND